MAHQDDTTIRAASPADAPAVAACTRAAYAKYVARLGGEPKPMTWDYADVLAKQQIWVAEGADGCRGILVLDPGDGHLLIANIAVDPRHQGRRLGHRLLALAEAEARRQGLPAVRLYTNAKMTENIAWYAHLGYRETERRPHETRPGWTVVFMQKESASC